MTNEIKLPAFVPIGQGNRIHDPAVSCPVCRSKHKMEFRPNPPRHVREWKGDDGQLVRMHYGRSADYDCTSCGCEFTLTNIGNTTRKDSDDGN